MKCLNVKFDDQRQYDILIESGILLKTGEYVKKLFPKAQKIAIICDCNVEKLYSKVVADSVKSAGFECFIISFEAGETSKSHDNLIMIYDRLTEDRFTRSDAILALGGGVTGDMAGFAAGTYLRGIGFVQIPTTLLSMVDSSVGGKVAVNLKGGKNLVGMFYQPKAVLCDTDALDTLSNRVFSDGMAEVVKHAFIKDKGLYDSLLNKDFAKNNKEQLIYQNCYIKSRVVLADEFDMGERMVLNFGHTIGHAIEKYYNYEKYTHGEAVAIGMAEICKIGEHLSITPGYCTSAVVDMLKSYGLPYRIDGGVLKSLADTIKNDKKNFGSSLTLVLLKDIGQAVLYKINTSEFCTLLKKGGLA